MSDTPNSAPESVWSSDPVFVSYAQNWEDVVLWRVLKNIEHGVYVDVGAADPVVDSVTKAFYDRGWSGINIEPMSEYHAALVTARPRDVNVLAGAGSESGQLTLHGFAGTGLSTFVNEVADVVSAQRTDQESVVEIRRLDDILDASLTPADDIHFLKIDVEGFEPDVLLGLDLSVWRPWILVVEATAPSSRRPAHHLWEGGVLSAGYRFALFDGLNRFYVADERAEQLADLSHPACVFDAPFESAARHRELAGLRDTVRRLEQELQEKQRVIEGASRELTVKQETLEHVITELATDRRALEVQAEELFTKQQALDATVEQLAVQRAELERIQSSGRWRLTRPLRKHSRRSVRNVE